MKSTTKKIVLFIAIMLCVCTSMFAEVDSVVYSHNTDTTKVTEQQIYSDVKSTLDGLSKSLKVGAEHVYEVMVKQQVVNSLIYLIPFIIGIILIFPFVKFIKFLGKKEFDFDEDAGFIFLSIFWAIIILIFLSVGLFNLDTIITGFINPEYGAIQDISNLIHH